MLPRERSVCELAIESSYQENSYYNLSAWKHCIKPYTNVTTGIIIIEKKEEKRWEWILGKCTEYRYMSPFCFWKNNAISTLHIQ